MGVFPCDDMNACVCVGICGHASVSAENLEKSLRQMERQLLQLERDLETFSSPDDPDDMFFTKMAISFCKRMQALTACGHYSRMYAFLLNTVVLRRLSEELRFHIFKSLLVTLMHTNHFKI